MIEIIIKKIFQDVCKSIIIKNLVIFSVRKLQILQSIALLGNIRHS